MLSGEVSSKSQGGCQSVKRLQGAPMRYLGSSTMTLFATYQWEKAFKRKGLRRANHRCVNSQHHTSWAIVKSQSNS